MTLDEIRHYSINFPCFRLLLYFGSSIFKLRMSSNCISVGPWALPSSFLWTRGGRGQAAAAVGGHQESGLHWVLQEKTGPEGLCGRAQGTGQGQGPASRVRLHLPKLLLGRLATGWVLQFKQHLLSSNVLGPVWEPVPGMKGPARGRRPRGEGAGAGGSRLRTAAET